MKLPPNISAAHRRSGASLIECLVYIAVFAVLLGGGTAAFFFCWDHTRAVIYATEDVSAALRAGERWRADVRAATGKISVETQPSGERVRIPQAEKEIVYHFAAGEVRREIPARNQSQLLLPKVKLSVMQTERRGTATAWRWELELQPRRQETRLPLLFTFEAAQLKP